MKSNVCILSVNFATLAFDVTFHNPLLNSVFLEMIAFQVAIHFMPECHFTLTETTFLIYPVETEVASTGG